MKNDSNRFDPKIEKLIEGLTPSQIRLLADIYGGLAKRLRKPNNSTIEAKARNASSRN